MCEELEEAEINLDRYLSTKVSEMMKWEESLTPPDVEKLKPACARGLKVPFADRRRSRDALSMVHSNRTTKTSKNETRGSQNWRATSPNPSPPS